MLDLTRRAFLNVTRSAAGRAWQPRLDAAGETAALAIAQRHGIPELLARVLAGRGVGLDEVPGHLDPDAARPDARSPTPDRHGRRRPGASRDACQRGEHGRDLRRLRRRRRHSCGAAGALPAPLGLDPIIYIPDRLFDGYGPNVDAIADLAEAAPQLLVTVDCGTTSFEPLEDARRLGLDVVVDRPPPGRRGAAAGARHRQSQPPRRPLRPRPSRRGRASCS